MQSDDVAPPPGEREGRILDAVLALLASGGISAVSMRAVSREAGVALGLVNYYYPDKTELIAAALRRIEAQDVALVTPAPTRNPERRVLQALRRVWSPEFLSPDYLALRLQLWSLAQSHDDFAAINEQAQRGYRAALAELIGAARPHLNKQECLRRATDVSLIQNGMWLTALIGVDRAALKRSAARCEEIALAD